MKIKVKIFFDNASPEKKPLIDYLLGCIGQWQIGHNLHVTTNRQAADVELDVTHLETKDQADAAVPVIERELVEALLKKVPRSVYGQKKARKRLK